MIDESKLFARQMAIGAEKSRFEMLAAAYPEFQRVDAGADRGQRARAAAQAALAGGGKAVIIGAIGQQPRDIDMDAVAEFGMPQFGALRHQPAQAAVPRGAPTDPVVGKDGSV